jgi:RNA polymerase sigma factor (sigma-70 family)
VDFEAFVHAEIGGLTRYAGVLVRDRQLAHDVLADALIAAAARWPRIGAMTNPLSYVQRMVVTTFLADRRTAARRRTEPTDAGELAGHVDARQGVTAPDPAQASGDRDEVERLLRGLPRQQRAALVLRYYLDWPDDEIAQALGCAPATVRSHLSRALATLRAVAADSDRSERDARAGRVANDGPVAPTGSDNRPAQPGGVPTDTTFLTPQEGDRA